MINERKNKKYAKDIHQRIYDFIIRVLDLAKALPKTQENLIIIPQLNCNF